MFINHTVKALTVYWLRQRRSILLLFACGGGWERAEAERSVSDSFWRGQDVTLDPWLPGQTLIHTHTPKVSRHCFPGTRLLTILREGSQREEPPLPNWDAFYSGKRDQWDLLFTTHQERKDWAVQSGYLLSLIPCWAQFKGNWTSTRHVLHPLGVHRRMGIDYTELGVRAQEFSLVFLG